MKWDKVSKVKGRIEPLIESELPSKELFSGTVFTHVTEDERSRFINWNKDCARFFNNLTGEIKGEINSDNKKW